LLDRRLPPLLRVGVVVLALVYLLPVTLDPGGREALAPWPDRPLPAFTGGLPALLTGVTALMLALGWLTRVAALGLLIPTLMTILAAGLNLWSGLLLAGALLLMLLGGGNWSLWRLDDLWVLVRAGESR
jgi:hypothetical protein